MTTTHSERQPGVREITVHDGISPLKFNGELVADLSWDYKAAEERGHKRWTDITLYRVIQDDTPYQYVVQVTGRSVWYHRHDGPCHRGVSVEVGSLFADDARYQALVACTRCMPVDLDDLDSADVVAVEQNLYTLYRCHNAEAVVQTMYGRSTEVSSLSTKLLQAACLADKAIEAAMTNARRL